jgi:hypothetical protein
MWLRRRKATTVGHGSGASADKPTRWFRRCADGESLAAAEWMGSVAGEPGARRAGGLSRVRRVSRALGRVGEFIGRPMAGLVSRMRRPLSIAWTPLGRRSCVSSLVKSSVSLVIGPAAGRFAGVKSSCTIGATCDEYAEAECPPRMGDCQPVRLDPSAVVRVLVCGACLVVLQDDCANLYEPGPAIVLARDPLISEAGRSVSERGSRWMPTLKEVTDDRTIYDRAETLRLSSHGQPLTLHPLLLTDMPRTLTLHESPDEVGYWFEEAE